MDKWFKDILPDKDPYHNRGRGQMRKKGLNRQIWYRHPNSETGNDEIQNIQREKFYFVGITF
jgi:hypothetical protein